MRQHRGEILEAVVRRSGYSLKFLADRLGISRNTLYNRFKEHDLSYDFILQVGGIIHYDFTYEYPEIKTTFSLAKNQHAAELWRLEQKYRRLPERYNKLLSFLVKTANDYYLDKLKQEV
ncbi:MAG: helix-turn-helix domain-containing protein, partial [Bacteroidota bacterium]